MLPSKRLIVLVGLAGPLFLGGALYGPLAVFSLLYVLGLALAVMADALLLPRSRSVSIRREAPARVSIGRATPIVLYVGYAGRRPAVLHLAEDLPEGLEADPPVCTGVFPSRSAGRLAYRLTARRRGAYRLNALDVRILPRSGLLYRQFRFRLPDELDVYPDLVDVQRYDLLVRRGLSASQGLARQRQIGQGTEFESLRLYDHGDDLARVDWKATARRGRLVTRNYQPERQQSVLAAIDVGRATAGELEGVSRLDHFVNAALMLAYVTLRQGDWFSLLAFSDRIESYLPPVRRVESTERVARALYKLQSRLVESDYGGACHYLDLRYRKRSLVCLMTDIIDRDASSVLLGYLARFAQRHLPLAVTLSDPALKEFAGAPLSRTRDPHSKAVALDLLRVRGEALATMRGCGVEVLDVPPNQLTPDLIDRYLKIKAARRL